MSRVLVISDSHAPFSHRDILPFLKAVAAKYKTNEVVHIGDEADFAAISSFDLDPDGYSAGKELEAAIEALKKMYKLFPEVKVCTSNHTARPFKKAFHHGIPKAFLRDYREFLQAPKKWNWKDSWEIDGIKYQHGEGFSGQAGALKAAMANMQSTVIGHIHAFAGIQYNANPHHLIFGMNVGCLIDNTAYAFSYGRLLVNKPIISCGVVLDGLPLLVPMKLNANGRWVGSL